MSGRGWIGVDLDGTLAHYDGWRGVDHIGLPVEPMLERVMDWIAKGKTVKIFTARANSPLAVPHIEMWLEKYGIGGLEITATKDYQMIQLWDDRCVQVASNTGKPLFQSFMEVEADVAAFRGKK